jgi:cell division protease FtsH
VDPAASRRNRRRAAEVRQLLLRRRNHRTGAAGCSRVSQPPPYLDVHCAAKHAELGKAYREQLVDRAYDVDNPFRGRTLVANLTTGLDFDVVHNFGGPREDVILPEGIWRELDENIRGLCDRVDVLRRADLGTNRGILLVGPPGTGKTAACRVIASELVGRVTVVLSSASVAQNWLRPLYKEVGHLSPALVLLEDLDLIVGDRDSGYTNKAALAEFLNVLDGLMTAHQGVAMIATTNDPRTIDAAAKRSARFDRVLQIPLPDVAARAKILNVYLRALKVKGNLTPVAQATKGSNGADLRELVRRAVLRYGERPTVQQLVALGEQLPRSTRVPAGFRLKTA